MAQCLPGRQTMAVLEPCEDSKKQPSLSVTTGLVSLAGDGTKCQVPVEITNVSDEPTVIYPKAKLATLHLASTVEDPFPSNPPSAAGSFGSSTHFDLSKAPLSTSENERAHNLLQQMSSQKTPVKWVAQTLQIMGSSRPRPLQGNHQARTSWSAGGIQSSSA